MKLTPNYCALAAITNVWVHLFVLVTATGFVSGVLGKLGTKFFLTRIGN